MLENKKTKNTKAKAAPKNATKPKKVAKKQTKDVEIDNGVPVLTEMEVSSLELKAECKKSSKLEVEKADQEIYAAELHIKNTELILEKQKGVVAQARTKKLSKLDEYKKKDIEYKGLVAHLTRKYKIEVSNWGYNPETGEVVTGEPES